MPRAKRKQQNSINQGRSNLLKPKMAVTKGHAAELLPTLLEWWNAANKKNLMMKFQSIRKLQVSVKFQSINTSAFVAMVRRRESVPIA